MLRPLIIFVLAAALPGCAYHSLTVPEPNRADGLLHTVNTSAVGWGAIEDTKVASACAGTNSMSDVQVRTSFLQSLATVLTLGLWQPSQIRYRCGKFPTAEGEIPR